MPSPWLVFGARCPGACAMLVQPSRTSRDVHTGGSV
jgi:hypothetical protein